MNFQRPSEVQQPVATYVFTRCFVSILMLWFSFPPFGWNWLAWLALLPLVSLVVDSRRLITSHYLAIWLSGLVYWLGTFYFVPIPHPLLWIGWGVLSIYLACYLPFFVISARTLMFRFRVPALVAIPVAWTGWELVRCYLFTGMPLVCLSHSQYKLPVVIQISDLFGAYTLTFAIVLFTTALWLTFIRNNHLSRPAALPAMVMLAVVATVYVYGNDRLARDHRLATQPLVVGLIQGSVDTVFPDTEEEAIENFKIKTQQYINLTTLALSKWDDLDLIVWPENGWPYPDLEPSTDKSKMAPEEVRNYEEAIHYIWPSLFVANREMPHFIVGAESYNPVINERYASALSISSEAEILDRYYKKHLVMFGEYVPLSDWIPLLRKFPAIGTGLKSGKEPVTMDVAGRKIAPNICFESTVPHFIRNQVNALDSAGNEPEILLNITNDGWFYGTSCLDFHLACNVFRAVEMRKPLLVCANTGFSASINEKGEILLQGPRRDTEVLRAEVIPTDMRSLYRTLGDSIPIAFAFIAVIGWLIGSFSRSTSGGHQQSNNLAGTAADPPTRSQN